MRTNLPLFLVFNRLTTFLRFAIPRQIVGFEEPVRGIIYYWTARLHSTSLTTENTKLLSSTTRRSWRNSTPAFTHHACQILILAKFRKRTTPRITQVEDSTSTSAKIWLSVAFRMYSAKLKVVGSANVVRKKECTILNSITSRRSETGSHLSGTLCFQSRYSALLGWELWCGVGVCSLWEVVGNNKENVCGVSGCWIISAAYRVKRVPCLDGEYATCNHGTVIRLTRPDSGWVRYAEATTAWRGNATPVWLSGLATTLLRQMVNR